MASSLDCPPDGHRQKTRHRQATETRQPFDDSHPDSTSSQVPTQGSVSLWIRGLRSEADQRAANHLYHRYFTKLVTRLRYRINRQVQAIMDSEDAAQYVLSEVLTKLGKGQYPQLSDRDSLWNLMIRIGDQRAKQVWRNATAGKRDVRLAARPGASELSAGEQAPFDPEAPAVSPRLEVEIQDMVQYLSNRISDKEYRDLLIWELQGYSAVEMKQRLQVQLCRPISDRSFRRWRETMRQELTAAYSQVS